MIPRKAKRDMSGDRNPNYRGGCSRVCDECGRGYDSYVKTRKYCSSECYNSKRKRLSRPKAQRAPAPSPVKKRCVQCGAHIRTGTKYCSRVCSGLGKVAKRSKAICGHCGSEFDYPPSAKRRFCSYVCFVADGGPKRAGAASAEAIMKKYGAKKDANHAEIMAVINQYCAVKDLSQAGHGVPDGIAYVKGAWQLFDIKNPKTSYGRRGLNTRQKKWASDWRGGDVFLIYNIEEAKQFARGEFDGLKRESAGGMSC